MNETGPYSYTQGPALRIAITRDVSIGGRSVVTTFEASGIGATTDMVSDLYGQALRDERDIEHGEASDD